MTFAFVFPGQGSQSVGMLNSIADRPEVRATLEEASDALGEDVAKLIAEGPAEALSLTTNTQPVMLTAAIAFYRAWLASGGAVPKVMAGHSLGEYSALVAAGVISFKDAVPLVRFRAEAMQTAVPVGTGGMAAIMGEERAKVYELCREFDLEAANFNAPGQIIVSGEKSRVLSAVAAAKDRGIKKIIPLKVAGAYHSRLMEPARTTFATFLETMPFSAPRFRVFSNTTGQAIHDPDAIKAALVKQVVSSVLWEDCMRSAAIAGATEFWEFGPSGVLSGLARRTEKSWVVKSFSEFGDLAA